MGIFPFLPYSPILFPVCAKIVVLLNEGFILLKGELLDKNCVTKKYVIWI